MGKLATFPVTVEVQVIFRAFRERVAVAKPGKGTMLKFRFGTAVEEWVMSLLQPFSHAETFHPEDEYNAIKYHNSWTLLASWIQQNRTKTTKGCEATSEELNTGNFTPKRKKCFKSRIETVWNSRINYEGGMRRAKSLGIQRNLPF